MKWKRPHVSKFYEALGVVADGRIEISGNTAKVYSSSGNKFYEVTYDPDAHSIMSNDNAAYWQGTLGYPAIAFLLKTGVLEYRKELAILLKDIPWKDLNQKNKNDFDKTIEHIKEALSEANRRELTNHVSELEEKVTALDLSLLGKKKLPPKGY